jgi:hypothetical protein
MSKGLYSFQKQLNVLIIPTGVLKLEHEIVDSGRFKSSPAFDDFDGGLRLEAHFGFASNSHTRGSHL